MAEATRYDAPREETEILPNLLGLTTRQEIDEAEFEGLLFADRVSYQELTHDTVFDLRYIYKLHKLIFEKVYSFAGELRSVNISKGGFLFPSAEFLPNVMQTFEHDILRSLPNSYSNKEQLIKDIATVHAELLFIHPFREGNGRTARLLANMMSAQHGFSYLRFEEITESRMEEYIFAVQKASEVDYAPMTLLLESIF